jgi:dTDP-4-amino-4,6-dideoxygalactose transaminase
MACHHEPFYKNPRYTGKLPNTDQALESVIILPLYPQMTEEEQEYVIKTLLEAVGR